MRPLLLLFLFIPAAFGQTVTNGDFNATSTGWGCNPEATYFETTYGGSDPSNRVAEVDALAGLCQTISGFTVGELYSLTFDCSRRTTCGPAVQSLNVSIDGGALAPSPVSRTGAFAFITETFDFLATATTHTIDFSATISGTCGLILDNISITLISGLPVELTQFQVGLTNDCRADIFWETKSERNNDFFELQRSANGLDWEKLATMQGAGNSSEAIQYTFKDKAPLSGLSYYRLKQVDFDGNFEYHTIKSLKNTTCNHLIVYPNPTQDMLFIDGIHDETTIVITDMLGRKIMTYITDKETLNPGIDLSDFESGTYLLTVGNEQFKVVRD